MTTTINASTSSGIVATADGSGILKVQSNGVTTNALAWCNFNGTTSPGTIRSSYNVGSVTKNGTGDYTLNFTTALADANYAPVGMVGQVNPTSSIRGVCISATTAPTTSALRVSNTNTAGTAEDLGYYCIAVFGN